MNDIFILLRFIMIILSIIPELILHPPVIGSGFRIMDRNLEGFIIPIIDITHRKQNFIICYYWVV